LGVTIDPRAEYVYTANYNSNTVSSFTISQATGNLSAVASGTFTTATGPTCVSIEPALGIFLFTSNYLDGSLSGGELNANTGAVTATTDSPYPTSALPSCVTTVANGPHSTSVLTP
jgi:6-phosphogluconolactonase (cycloisomerase 2 family)